MAIAAIGPITAPAIHALLLDGEGDAVGLAVEDAAEAVDVVAEVEEGPTVTNDVLNGILD